MTRWLLLACALIAPGCAAMPRAKPVACSASGLAALIGKPATIALVADAKKRSGATLVRRIAADAMVTMDYRADRLNLRLDAQDKIAAITCG